MTDIYKRFAVVVADLARLDITNADPMRYSKRCCVLAAQEALDEGVRRAEAMLRIANAIESDSKELINDIE